MDQYNTITGAARVRGRRVRRGSLGGAGRDHGRGRGSIGGRGSGSSSTHPADFGL